MSVGEHPLSPWRVPPTPLSRPYLDATEAGADDGAVVGGGAAGTCLTRHPEEVEGAAVAGALGAFAGGGGYTHKKMGRGWLLWW